MHVSLSRNLLSTPASFAFVPTELWAHLAISGAADQWLEVSASILGTVWSARGNDYSSEGWGNASKHHGNLIWGQSCFNLFPLHITSKKKIQSADCSVRVFEKRGTYVLSVEVNPYPRQTYCCRKLQIDFGAVVTISKCLLALGSELKTTLHFPLTNMTSAMRQQPAKCIGWLIAFFLARGKKMVLVTTKALPVLCLRLTHFCHVQTQRRFTVRLGGSS